MKFQPGGGAIRLHGVACATRLGMSAEERGKPQRVLVDALMELDLSRAAASDDVRDTVDYQAVERAVRRAAGLGERRLAERLAADLARAVLAADRRVRRVAVAVRKRPAAMPATREVVVELTRRRGRRSRASPTGARRRPGARASGRGRR